MALYLHVFGGLVFWVVFFGSVFGSQCAHLVMLCHSHDTNLLQAAQDRPDMVPRLLGITVRNREPRHRRQVCSLS